MNPQYSIFTFGAFILDPSKRTLKKGGEPMALPKKTFDILLTLLRGAGQVIDREEMLRKAWADTFVGDDNVTHHIYLLRRLFKHEATNATSSDQYIETVKGRGYKFVFPVTVLAHSAEGEPADWDGRRDMKVSRLAEAGNGENSTRVPETVEAGSLEKMRSLAGKNGTLVSASSAVHSRRTDVPFPLSGLIGRRIEIMDIEALLLRDSVRLVTLTGAPGSGKTRLALEIAGRLSDNFPDQVHFLSLAPVTAPELVAQTIAQTLNAPAGSDLSILDSIRCRIADKRVLLVLDNFEQVVEAAATLVDLLASCDGLKILVTSRVALNLSIEFEYPVPPLTLPDQRSLVSLEMLARNPAVALFVERAQAVRHDFDLNEANALAVAEICVRLDGLPLAIELAAPWLRVLDSQELLGRLDKRMELLTDGYSDLPPRQRTIRGAIESSYRLLCEQDKERFLRLSVFTGGFTVEAAQAIWELGAESEALASIRRLVRSSLVCEDDKNRGPQPRFTVLETIREFGWECVVRDGNSEDLRRLHLGYFVSLAEALGGEMDRRTTAVGLKLLASEIHNFRSAMQYASDFGDVESGARIAAALRKLWVTAGFWREGDRWLNTYYQGGNDLGPTVAARLLTALGVLERYKGSYAESRNYLTRALDHYNELGLKDQECDVLGLLGETLFADARYDEAQTVLSRGLQLAGSIGGQRLGRVLIELGLLAERQARFADAFDLWSQALSTGNLLGDQWLAQTACNNLAVALTALGEYDRAKPYARTALALSIELGAQHNLAHALTSIAELTCGERKLTDGSKLLAATESLRDRMGAPRAKPSMAMYAKYNALLEECLPAEMLRECREEGQAMSLDQACAFAFELLGPERD